MTLTKQLDTVLTWRSHYKVCGQKLLCPAPKVMFLKAEIALFQSLKRMLNQGLEEIFNFFLCQHGPSQPSSFCLNWLTCYNLWLGRTYKTKVKSGYSFRVARTLCSQSPHMSDLKEDAKFGHRTLTQGPALRQGNNGLNTFAAETCTHGSKTQAENTARRCDVLSEMTAKPTSLTLLHLTPVAKFLSCISCQFSGSPRPFQQYD